MKKHLLLLLTGLMLCSGKCKKEQIDTQKTYLKNALIHQKFVSRGAWQWFITIDKDTVMTKTLPERIQINNQAAVLTFNFTGELDTLYQIGPVDLPELYGVYPSIAIQSFELIKKE